MEVSAAMLDAILDLHVIRNGPMSFFMVSVCSLAPKT